MLACSTDANNDGTLSECHGLAHLAQGDFGTDMRMISSRLIWAFIGCLASLSAHAQVTIIDAADYVAVIAETPEANEVSCRLGRD